MLGLLAGTLTSIWLRSRIHTRLSLSAVAIPLAFAGWFINAKAGQRELASVFIVVGLVAAFIFLASAATLLARRQT